MTGFKPQTRFDCVGADAMNMDEGFGAGVLVLILLFGKLQFKCCH